MKVRVRLFASYGEAAGFRQRELEVGEGATAADVLSMLRKGPLLTLPGTARPLFAVNRTHVAGDHVLKDGDEIGIFPPVSGGSGGSALDLPLLLTANPLDAHALARAVRADRCGAVVTFEGTVRDENDGQAVTGIEYEAYTEMALDVLRGIRREILERWPDVALAMAHRTGQLTVGETSVVVACSAPHRREAFAACRLAMDRIKESLPVWKHERGDSGEGSWR